MELTNMEMGGATFAQDEADKEAEQEVVGEKLTSEHLDECSGCSECEHDA